MSLARKIFRDIKRGLIILFIISVAGSVFYTIKKYGGKSKKNKFSAIVDCDAGNGIDDLFALSRILADPEFELIGITSSQWDFSSDSIKNTANISYELVDSVLKLFKNQNMPHFYGGSPIRMLSGKLAFDPSEAARFIVRKAHEVQKNKKLNIIALGSLSNPASAILLDSSIAPKIRIYALAMKFSTSSKIWNKNEMNVRNDLDALDLLLNKDELEMHFMPVTVAGSLVIDSSQVSEIMRDNGSQWVFLMDQWTQKYPRKKELALPGLALVESYMKPDFVKVEQTNSPPENRRRMIFVYTWINKDQLINDYLNTIRKNIKKN